MALGARWPTSIHAAFNSGALRRILEKRVG
jgi:hypothetical protein